MQRITKITVALLLGLGFVSPLVAEDAIDIGSRRELFVDDFLIDRMTDGVSLELQQPRPAEVVLTTDRPWEGNTCAYYTLFEDGGLYRLYYRGSHHDEATEKSAHEQVTCYAESRDGIHFSRPSLGFIEFDGSTDNNIVWNGPGGHNFVPFKDENPNCSEDARYKAVASSDRALYAFKSADGLRWSNLVEEPIITKGAFDSQNLAFWDPVDQLYREYHRDFADGIRKIRTGKSQDFLTWTDPKFIEFVDSPNEHLYTNQIRRYDRAPHLFIGFPTRFRPDLGEQTEPLFMSSRDGVTFRRGSEPVIPTSAPADRDGNRSNYITYGLVSLPGDERELSIYANEAYYTGPDSRLRRFVYRADGFVSLSSAASGEVVTHPLQFAGDSLKVNFLTRDGGSLRFELQDDDGTPVPGYSLNECRPLTGDEIDQTVGWNGNGDLGALQGKPVRVRLVLENADVFAFQFGD